MNPARTRCPVGRSASSTAANTSAKSGPTAPSTAARLAGTLRDLLESLGDTSLE
jgi:hypothetical protein